MRQDLGANHVQQVHVVTTVLLTPQQTRRDDVDERVKNPYYIGGQTIFLVPVSLHTKPSKLNQSKKAKHSTYIVIYKVAIHRTSLTSRKS